MKKISVVALIATLVCSATQSAQSAPQTFVFHDESGQWAILLDQPLSAWKRIYGSNFETADGNEHQKNWKLPRFLFMVMFSGKPSVSTRIKIVSEYDQPPISLDQQGKIMNALGLRSPEFDPSAQTISWGKASDPISGIFYADLGILDIQTSQAPPEE